MKEKDKALLASAIIQIVGFGLVWIYAGWAVSAGVYLCVWGVNITHAVKYKPVEQEQ